jgi:hypothetical protein
LCEAFLGRRHAVQAHRDTQGFLVALVHLGIDASHGVRDNVIKGRKKERRDRFVHPWNLLIGIRWCHRKETTAYPLATPPDNIAGKALSVMVDGLLQLRAQFVLQRAAVAAAAASALALQVDALG